jgi:hypothetical protein
MILRDQRIGNGEVYRSFHFVAGPGSGAVTITVSADYGSQAMILLLNVNLDELKRAQNSRQDQPVVLSFEPRFQAEYIVRVGDSQGRAIRFDISYGVAIDERH